MRDRPTFLTFSKLSIVKFYIVVGKLKFLILLISLQIYVKSFLIILEECLINTIGHKIVESLSSNGIISGINPPPPLSSIQSWSVCCSLQVAQTAVEQCVETGEDGEGKASFSPFEASKK